MSELRYRAFKLLIILLPQFLAVKGSPRTFHVALNTEGTITLDWLLDYPKNTVWFEIHSPNDFKWFAFGFSNYGEPYPGDYCVLWLDWRKQIHFQDVWADTGGVLHLERDQNCNNFKINQIGNMVKFAFSREFDTCDDNDYIIQDGTTHIIWAKGNESLYHLQGLNISVNSHMKGMVRTQLLKNIDLPTNIPKDAEKFEVLTEKVAVPNEETTYWCHVLKLPEKFKQKHHVIQYEPAIEKKNEGLVHHMEVFHCIAPISEEIDLYRGSCFAKERPENTKVCKRVLAAWAMGAKAFVYPEEAALPIGGPDFNPYIMLEVHYNNPNLIKGVQDSSGVRFYVTPNLRSMDAGVIELGLEYTDKMAIPPGETAFSLSGYCVSECTAVSVPPTGITVFGSQLHTHLTGVRVITRHFRDGTELPELNRDDHYSTHFQEIRRLKRSVRVLPGDSLITTCDYKTEDRTNITLGGFSISDEMCVNYIHYFPSTDLEVCKSAISDQALTTYFNYMNEWESQNTNPNKEIAENYKSIEWNKMRVQLLADVYKEAPLSMQCNMSSGDRFPGYWENTPLTPVLRPLPPPSRKCRNH